MPEFIIEKINNIIILFIPTRLLFLFGGDGYQFVIKPIGILKVAFMTKKSCETR